MPDMSCFASRSPARAVRVLVPRSRSRSASVAVACLLALLRVPLFAQDGPLAPDAALRSFVLEPGLRAELVAAEPLTASPVAIAWDERGRLFVAENRGYPTGPGEGKPPAGIIAMLEDTDGDGRMDRRTVFADNLTFPNGLMPWRGGWLVTCAPDLLYLKDTDGDGRADERRVLLTGFSTRGSTQLRVSHPTLGPDGWVYLTSGLTGGKITCPDHPERPPFESSGDVRFHPDTLAVETADGRGQFGQTFDDFGRRFVCYNRVPVQHVVISSRHLKRNPALAFSETMQNCNDAIDNPFMRGGAGGVRIYPVSANITTADSHLGTFSAACAVTIYRGHALPAEYQGCAFTCDPTGNLVHYDRLEPRGATFAAKRVREGTEFLASKDNLFRPCFLANGPDGALYLCDMYRKTIEHPEYLPVEVRKRSDFESGKGMGRIWRVTGARASKFARLPASLSSGSSREWLKELDAADGWRRDTAFRRLVETRDATVAPLLAKAVLQRAPVASRVAKLRVAAVLGGLTEEILARALRDAAPEIRENALQLAEKHLARSPRLQSLVLKMADDPDARVRFHAALAVGGLGVIGGLEPTASSGGAVNALVRIARQDAGDRWARAAILSSLSIGQADFIHELMVQPATRPEGEATLLYELGRMIGAAFWSEPLAAQVFPKADGQDFERRAALLVGMNESGKNPAAPPRELVEGLAALRRQAAVIAGDSASLPDRRLWAVRFLGTVPADQAALGLTPLLDASQPVDLRAAAVRALIRPDNVAAVGLVAGRWGSLTPALRELFLGLVTSRAEYLPGLLGALESGQVPASALDSGRRDRLLKHKESAIRARAEVLYRQTDKADRLKAYGESKAALSLKASPANGRIVFQRACANCHRLEQQGFAVGPDLFDVRNQPKEALLLHIVIPEHEIAPNFTSYTVETKDGRSLSGILLAETATSITLRQPLGVEETLLRVNVASLMASPLSLMPQDLEKNMTRQEMADLLGFLKGE